MGKGGDPREQKGTHGGHEGEKGEEVPTNTGIALLYSGNYSSDTHAPAPTTSALLAQLGLGLWALELALGTGLNFTSFWALGIMTTALCAYLLIRYDTRSAQHSAYIYEYKYKYKYIYIYIYIHIYTHAHTHTHIYLYQ